MEMAGRAAGRFADVVNTASVENPCSDPANGPARQNNDKQIACQHLPDG